MHHLAHALHSMYSMRGSVLALASAVLPGPSPEDGSKRRGLLLSRMCRCGHRPRVSMMPEALAELRRYMAGPLPPDLVLMTYDCPRCKQHLQLTLQDLGLA